MRGIHFLCQIINICLDQNKWYTAMSQTEKPQSVIYSLNLIGIHLLLLDTLYLLLFE